MSDQTGTDGNNSSTTDGNAGGHAVQPPQAPAQQPANNPPSQSPGDIGGLIRSFTDTMNALPETIARSVKEAVGTPQSATRNAPSDGGNAAQNNAGAGSQSADKGTGGASKTDAPSVPGNTAKPNRFAQWWFGQR